jgi:hypothetical protein
MTPANPIPVSAQPAADSGSGLSVELAAFAAAAGQVAAAILAVTGAGAVAKLIPLTETLLATAIKAWTSAHGAAPTIEQLQALLVDIPLVPPTAT